MKQFKKIYALTACMSLAVGLFSACSDDILPTQANTDATQSSVNEAFPWQPGLAFIKLKANYTPTTRAASQSVTRAKVFEKHERKSGTGI